MKKNICKILLLLLFIPLFLTGCKDKETGILFNKEPISKENFLQCSREFEVGKRIYYLFYTHQELKTDFIRVQLFKADDKVPRGGYTVKWAKDYRVMKNNHYYFQNHFTVYEEGRYVLQVFDVHSIGTPLAWNYFYIR